MKLVHDYLHSLIIEMIMVVRSILWNFQIAEVFKILFRQAVALTQVFQRKFRNQLVLWSAFRVFNCSLSSFLQTN